MKAKTAKFTRKANGDVVIEGATVRRARKSDLVPVNDPTPMMSEPSTDQLISQAIEKGVDVGTMERLLAMRKELRAEFAEEQYNRAMAKFQSECPVIEKRKQAKDGEKLLYKYAPLDDIVEQTRDIIANNGFSYSWDTEENESTITVFCIVTHTNGHSKRSRFNIPSKGGTSIMSGPQKAAAALTFGKRYAFCNAFGIMTGDEDVDAAKNVVEPEAKKEKPAPKEPVYVSGGTVIAIRQLFEQLNVDETARLSWLMKVYKASGIEYLTVDQGKKVMEALQAKLKKAVDEKKETVVNIVDPSMTGKETAPIDSERKGWTERAMNCKNQTEAEEIMREMNERNESQPVKEVAKGIMTRIGFNL